ncbi:MAG: hypothetical protein AVDCRST_MAG77-5991 [uncultured Chloroflexi bacterium]|uniref:Uncharacterized protein n=1 Tax=uncultured Chloroflexota bacterium TaxID=166587 RepID=A0A6J4KC34_9CHLR|nr:MAG: hypothetical protein AVDCRST_MAG77-5991 [uncultured Chloroflexota bacterium]
MPAATNDQIPKPLTYTLMYHFLWFVLFLLSALTLWGIFLSTGRGFWLGFVPPLLLVVLALIAGIGFLATYVVRVQILLGDLDKGAGFRWSARSSWAVVLLAPTLFGVWKLVAEPLARHAWPGLWPVTVQMTLTTAEVEVVVWWLSHLLSVRGLARGRKVYLAPAAPQVAAATPA